MDSYWAAVVWSLLPTIVVLGLFAFVLRSAVEVGTLLTQPLPKAHTNAIRTVLQSMSRFLYFVGAPAWLLWRLLGA